MQTFKEKIIQRVNDINDDELLKEIYSLMIDIQETKKIIVFSEEQKQKIEEARKDYSEGRYHTTDNLFKELLDE